MPYGKVAETDSYLFSCFVFNVHCENGVPVQVERVFVMAKYVLYIEPVHTCAGRELSGAADAGVTTIRA